MPGDGNKTVYNMKHSITIFALLLTLGAFGQTKGSQDRISRFRPGVMWFLSSGNPAHVSNPRKYDRFMVDLTYNDWVSDSSLFRVKPASIGFNVHGMWDVPLTAGNGIGIAIGLSYRYQHVRYDGVMLRDSANQATHWVLFDGSQPGPDKSAFASHALAIPLELRFRIPKWRHVKLHLGGYIGYRLQTYTKVWTNDKQTSVKDRMFYDDEPLMYGVHARLGIRNLALFADYSLSKQFKSAQSTSLQPLSLGITVSFF